MAQQPAGSQSEIAVLGARPLGPQDPAMVGRYRIHALLGIGGMGRVYLGWAADHFPGAARSGSWVAVKVIRPDLADNPEFRRRFARELEAVGRVSTPYAAALVHGEPESQQPWMATEFVPGVSLSDAVQAGKPLPAQSVWRLADDLGHALVAVHQAGLVHRDVKPSNVILGTGGAKIIDFGVAHASDLSQLTATGMNIGTPSYMAPEQAKSGEVSPASDVFSLGVLLFFAATGRLPFGEGGTAEVLFRVVYEEPDVSALTAVDVDPALRDLVLRCMAKDPLQRPNAAGVVAMAETAASAGVWVANGPALWPEALAARISERTLAAGRTLPELNGPEPAEFDAPPVPHPFAAANADDTPTTFTAAPPAKGKKRHGTLIGSVAAVVVLAVGVTAMLLWSPGSNGAVDASSTVNGHTTQTATASVSATLTGAVPGAASTGTAKSSASSSVSSSGSASTSASVAPGSSSSAGSVVGASTGTQTTAAGSTTSAVATTTTSSPSTPNKYTAKEACGSGYAVDASHSISGATIYLLYNSSTGYNCVVTLATYTGGSVPMSATLKVEGGSSKTDSGSYTYYAGPVSLSAPGKCVIYGGSYNGSSWIESSWGNCG